MFLVILIFFSFHLQLHVLDWLGGGAQDRASWDGRQQQVRAERTFSGLGLVTNTSWGAAELMTSLWQGSDRGPGDLLAQRSDHRPAGTEAVLGRRQTQLHPQSQPGWISTVQTLVLHLCVYESVCVFSAQWGDHFQKFIKARTVQHFIDQVPQDQLRVFSVQLSVNLSLRDYSSFDWWMKYSSWSVVEGLEGWKMSCRLKSDHAVHFLLNKRNIPVLPALHCWSWLTTINSTNTQQYQFLVLLCKFVR